VISAEFRFETPKTVAEALAVLEAHAGECKVLAGGMTLLPMMTLNLLQPSVLVSLNHIPELSGIEESEDVVRLGAMLRHEAVHDSSVVRVRAPLVSLAAGSIGDVQVRNRGTIGGSLAHAEPAADYPCATATLEARFRLDSQSQHRWLSAGEFFVDVMTTALAPDELLTQVEIPVSSPGAGCAHMRLRRVEGAFPIVVASSIVEPGYRRARLGLGGVGARPIVLDVTDELRDGLAPAALAKIGDRAHAAADGALDDLNASSTYRREMARVYSQRAVRAAVSNMHTNSGEVPK
tara:strand:+ start:4878 stop:5753 length:876 start_codon:yes stop_codon:yes gene_type:complete